MPRTEAIDTITAKLASLDDERLMTVADFVQSVAAANQTMQRQVIATYIGGAVAYGTFGFGTAALGTGRAHPGLVTHWSVAWPTEFGR